jgi:hypothetical protein
VNARITHVTLIKQVGVGCPSLKLQYQFSDGDELRDGQERIPFAAVCDAERFARRWSKDQVVIVRVNPVKPTDTHVFRMDQK